MRRFSLARRRLPGVVSLLDVVIHHQISKQLPGVPPRVPRHGLLLLTLLLKGVVMVLSVNLEGRLPSTAADESQTVVGGEVGGWIYEGEMVELWETLFDAEKRG